MATNGFTANEIDPRVYLGDKKSSKNLPYSITHAISLRSRRPRLMPDQPSRKQMFIRARDKKHENLTSVFGICYDFIRTALEENQTNRILIHCRKGKSRSATIAMMYLMKRHGWSYRRAENHLTSIRPQIDINEGFENQLRTFSEVIQSCTNWPYCACSDCHDLYATADDEDDSDYDESDDDE